MRLENVKFNASTFVFIISTLCNLSNSQISVIYPEGMARLFKDGKIKASYALFGEIPYGTTTIVKLENYKLESFTPPYLACDPISDNTNALAQDEKNDNFGYVTKAILIERGDCSFVTKTRNVQKVGGQLSLIMNNNDMSLEDVFLADDGTGNDIVVPTLFISKNDGEILKEYLSDSKQKDKVILSVDFSISHTNKVQYDLFFSSDNLEMYKYLSDFEYYYAKIHEMGIFNVHYVSYISDDYITNNNPREVDNCLSSGRYCALPRFDLGIMDGRTIIQENIRQQCIFSISYSKNTVDPLRKDYFKYIRGFYNKCLSLESKIFSEACSTKVILEDLDKVSLEDVNRCVFDSYDSPLTQANAFIVNNKILDQHYTIEKNLNVQVLPGIIVNGREIYGGIKAYNLFEAICGAFLTAPPVCSQKEILAEPNTEKEKNDLSTGVIVLIIFIVILINIIVVYICKRYIVKKMHEKIESSEMNGKINNVVTAYLQLRDK